MVTLTAGGGDGGRVALVAASQVAMMTITSTIQWLLLLLVGVMVVGWHWLLPLR